MTKSSPYPGSLKDYGGGVQSGILDANADGIPDALVAAIADQYAPLPETVGTAGQVLAIDTADPLVTEWVDQAGGTETMIVAVPTRATGAVTFTATGRASWRFVDGETIVNQYTFRLPTSWATFDAELIYQSSAPTVTGDAHMQCSLYSDDVPGTAFTTLANVVGVMTVPLAASGNEWLSFAFAAGLTNPAPGRLMFAYVRRNGGDVSDTFTGEVRVAGIRFTKAS